uniref:Uncharacterized protein n=1 Tax=Anguilla anguilla TaxID=7936 RepID=A0A0E9R106_ANGAN
MNVDVENHRRQGVCSHLIAGIFKIREFLNALKNCIHHKMHCDDFTVL